MSVTHIVDVANQTVTKCNKCGGNTCANTCNDTICLNVSVETLRSSLLKARGFIADYGVGVSQENSFGYTTMKICPKKVSKAIRLSQIIHKKYVSLLHNEVVCFCDNVVNSAIQRLNEILPSSCERFSSESYINKDTSLLEEWIKYNPNCVSFEKWERALHNFKYEFTFDIQQVDCSIAYHFLVSNINCDLIADLNIVKDKSCELSTKFDITKQENCDYKFDAEFIKSCKYEYDIVKEKTNCDLTIDTYIDLIACGIDKQVIANLVSCNLDFEVTNKEIKVKTKNTSSSVNDLNFDVIESLIK